MKKTLALLLFILLGTVQTLYAQLGSIDKKSTSVNKKVINLLKPLQAEGVILGRAVGFAGEERPPYKAFQQLVKIATTDELLVLTEHSSPTIRGYAFWAILLKDKGLAAELEPRFHSDTSMVETNLRGCIQTPYRMDGFVKFLMNVSDQYMPLYYSAR